MCLTTPNRKYRLRKISNLAISIFYVYKSDHFQELSTNALKKQEWTTSKKTCHYYKHTRWKVAKLLILHNLYFLLKVVWHTIWRKGNAAMFIPQLLVLLLMLFTIHLILWYLRITLLSLTNCDKDCDLKTRK